MKCLDKEVWIAGGDVLDRKILEQHASRWGYTCFTFDDPLECLDVVLMGYSGPRVILIPRGFSGFVSSQRLIRFLNIIRPRIAAVELSKQELLALGSKNATEESCWKSIGSALDRLSDFYRRLGGELNEDGSSTIL